jgi:hypothetical protein
VRADLLAIPTVVLADPNGQFEPWRGQLNLQVGGANFSPHGTPVEIDGLDGRSNGKQIFLSADTPDGLLTAHCSTMDGRLSAGSVCTLIVPVDTGVSAQLVVSPDRLPPREWLRLAAQARDYVGALAWSGPQLQSGGRP